MPIKLLCSMESRGFYEDIIESTCEYCNKQIDKEYTWEEGQVPRWMVNHVSNKLHHHESFCALNPDNQRTCETCVKFYDGSWFGGDPKNSSCEENMENFANRDARNCEKWSTNE